jgi:hypothetical protein
MKWIGQSIWDQIARFRNDVYLESISTGTIASGAHLGLDSNNKIVKAVDGGGDITSIVAGTGLSGTSLTGPIPTLNVDASQTQITSVGTIGTGVWQGTTIKTAYIGDDQVTEDKLAKYPRIVKTIIEQEMLRSKGSAYLSVRKTATFVKKPSSLIISLRKEMKMQGLLQEAKAETLNDKPRQFKDSNQNIITMDIV